MVGSVWILSCSIFHVLDDVELRHLAIQGISFLLDQIETNCRLEHVALLQFSSLCELTVPFTRDIDQVNILNITFDKIYRLPCWLGEVQAVCHIVPRQVLVRGWSAGRVWPYNGRVGGQCYCQPCNSDRWVPGSWAS